MSRGISLMFEERYTELIQRIDPQSTSQLSLKPSDEEIRKKGWWQFWK
jgi:hypothetical protein